MTLVATLVLPFGFLMADDSAVFLIYHRFGEDRYPSTNIKLDQFEAQIHELKQGGYHFLTLSEAVERIKSGASFEEKTVVITVDDAFESVKTEAWPRLKAAGIPMSLFVSTDPVDQGTPGYLSWDDIRELEADGVEIGHHGASHSHLIYEGEDAIRADIDKASARFQEELGKVPPVFAYPYGEYDNYVKALIESMGFAAALAQYSGAAQTGSDAYSLPRFPVNERYGDLNRFKLIAGSKALPVRDIIPTEPRLSETTNPPLFGFTVAENVQNLRGLACYPSHLGEAADVSLLEGNRVEIRFSEPFPAGRNRINCTMPAGDGRWYWFGRYFLMPGGVLD